MAYVQVTVDTKQLFFILRVIQMCVLSFFGQSKREQVFVTSDAGGLKGMFLCIFQR